MLIKTDSITRVLLPYFTGFCSSPELILLFVYMKCRFSLSYRDLEEMMRMRGAKIDHATLERWVIRFVPLIDQEVRRVLGKIMRKCTLILYYKRENIFIKLFF